ncbi:MAG: glycosyl hydrolase, partial [Acidobacteria bacterium]|nr:glycosyl hydrolase [Acidobacteriota bacterium]
GDGILEELFGAPPSGPLVMPGRFSVTMASRSSGDKGEWRETGQPQSFDVVTAGTLTLAIADRQKLVAFQQRALRLQRAVGGANGLAAETKSAIASARRAIQETPGAADSLVREAALLDRRLNEIIKALNGDRTLAARYENPPPSIVSRVTTVTASLRMANARPTPTQVAQYDIAASEFETILRDLRQLVEVDLIKLRKAMNAAGAPWTSGRIPEL